MVADRTESEATVRTAAQFATTHWSVVLAAGDSASPESGAALEKLCRQYWYPLYAFVRRKGHSPEDAKDLTQAFFARFLEKHYLRDVFAQKGRFRSFLLAALTHFLANEWDRTRTLKRGGDQTFVAFDAALLEERYHAEAITQDNPERHFDRLWAAAVMDRALARLEGELRSAGKASQFEALAEFLSRMPREGEYATLGERLGLNSHAVAVTVARLRERYRHFIRAEVENTVGDAEDVEAELQYLIELIAG